jgi:hypothetical protein
MGLFSNLVAAKPQQVQPGNLMVPEPDDLSRLTPEQWAEFYKNPHIMDLKNKVYPNEDRWDHPDIDNAVIQLATERARQNLLMTNLKTSAVNDALSLFGIKEAFVDRLSPEDEEEYLGNGGNAGLTSGSAQLATLLSALLHPKLLPMGLMAPLVGAAAGGVTAAAQAPQGQRLRHGLTTAGHSLAGAAGEGLRGAGISGAIGAGMGGLASLLTRGKIPMSAGLIGGGATGALGGGIVGMNTGAMHGAEKGQHRAQQASKKAPAKKSTEKKKSKSDGEKKAFDTFGLKEAGFLGSAINMGSKALKFGGRAASVVPGIGNAIGAGLSGLGGVMQASANGEGMKGMLVRGGLNAGASLLPGGAGIAAGMGADMAANKLLGPSHPPMPQFAS